MISTLSLCARRGPRFSGTSPRQAVLLERSLRFVKRRPRKTELGGCFGHAAALHQHLAQHLVFHLHQIVGIEERVSPEQIIADRIEQRIQAAMLTQCRPSCARSGFFFAILSSHC